jgi:sugar phosphate isomerase/epimerase
MGIAMTCYLTAWRPKDTLEFIEHARAIGAGGVQASLSSLDPIYLGQVRSKLEQYGLYFEVMAPLPRKDPSHFEAVLAAARETGAICVRSACLGGRRYETFSTLDAWRAFVADSRVAVRRAVAIATRKQVRLALENHKDWTAEEFVKLLKEFDSPWLGICLDTGNNLALLDDPMELVDALLPYTMSTHIKDMAVTPYPDGFLLSEVVLGHGFLDIAAIVKRIATAKPAVRLTLEMITRNPLEIPCLTSKYWATFPDRSGFFLARTLRMVEASRSTEPLPSIAGKSAAAQRELENENVMACLRYSRERLGV